LVLSAGTAAYAAAGDVDMSYGLGTGGSRPNFGFNESVGGVALQPDGKIVVGATQYSETPVLDGRLVVVRFLNPQGTLDPSFGGSNGQTIPFPGRIDLGGALVVQPDGAIVVAAADGTVPHQDMFVTRLTAADGSIDLGYGLGSGASAVNLGFNESGNAIALAPDGKIVVGGSGSLADGRDQLLVARLLNPQGTIDPSYGLATGASRPALAGQQEGRAVAVQPDGRILIAGITSPTQSVRHFIVARFLNPEGTNDASFGQGTSVATVDFGGFDTLSGMVLQPDGKIILAGSTDARGGSDVAVARLNTDGSLDETFGQDGKAIIDLGGSDNGLAVALQPDGKIIVAGGTLFGAALDFGVTRLQQNGSVDTTFGKGGKSIVDFGQNEIATAIALQPDGKIILAGNSTDAMGHTNMLVVRLLGDPPAATAAGGTGGQPASGSTGSTTAGSSTTGSTGASNTQAGAGASSATLAASKLKLSPSTFSARSSGDTLVAAGKRGAALSFTLNLAGRVDLTMQKATAGRKVKHRGKTLCDRLTGGNRGRPSCVHLVRLAGGFSVAGVAGAHTYTFTGRLNGHKLAPGRYLLTVTPVGAKHGAPLSVPFTIAR
jgi:uncharacterized delta-60 repeat protein